MSGRGLHSRHTDAARAQRDREEQTVAIGAALGAIALVVAIEILGIWLADVEVGGAIFGCAVVLAVAVALATLVRSERRSSLLGTNSLAASSARCCRCGVGSISTADLGH
jgi:hypothetical protein